MGKQRLVRSGAFVGAGLLVLTLLGACSGGGGGAPAVGFSFASATATVDESDGPTGLQVVLHTTQASLAMDASVDVVDLGTGTATSGSDYAAFAPQTITFPAGSVEGATQNVMLDPLDDLQVDPLNETIRLGMQNGVRGSPYGTAQLTATVTDADHATVAFATASASTPDEASGAQAVALELDCGPGVTLGVAVSVRVSDLRTGSAAASSDYSFSAQTVTFPAGSPDGAQVTVNVNVVDNATFESDETVELGLSTPSATCTLGTIFLHVLTIKDDDLATNAVFLGTEGASGTENPLAYDELVSLGSETVGAGPNTGTLVRVTNGGGLAMELGAPSLIGTNPNDFAVEIESSSMLPPGVPGSSSELTAKSPAPGEATPLVALPDDVGPGLALRLDSLALARLGVLERVELHDFALPDLGRVTLELERRPLPLTRDAKLVIDGQELAGGVRTLVGDLQLWRGVVAGMPGSRVFLALSGSGAQGFVELPQLFDRVHFFADGPGRVRLVREGELAALGAQPVQDFCAGERFAPGQEQLEQLVAPDAPSTGSSNFEPGALTVSDCTLALETDFQLFQIFGSSTLLTNYVTGLIGAVSDQYLTDVQTTLSIAYLGIHTTSNDGWSTQETAGTDAGDLLDEFMSDWGSSWPEEADLAHFLSGDSLGGGVAYVNVLCNNSFGFGVSANLNGAINWVTWTGQSAATTWDFVVVAHELGHNFGSQHTHDYCPPLDHCVTPNCDGTSSCSRGTIMSYCHVSCGGLANIDLFFHPVNANIMRQRVNASCLDDALLLGGDFVQYRVRFNPLTATGARSATLEFAHDATNVTQPFRMRLSGTAN